MVISGSLTSSPSVAIRAQPAKAKNMNPAASRTPPRLVSMGARRSALNSPPVQSDTTTMASAESETTRRTLVTATVRDNPPMFTAVMAITAATANHRCCSGQRYAPIVSAMAAHEAVLPTTKPRQRRSSSQRR